MNMFLAHLLSISYDSNYARSTCLILPFDSLDSLRFGPVGIILGIK